MAGLAILLCCLATNARAQPRIAALSWEMVEHLLKLGITPVAVADAPDYRSWVVHPALPPGVPNAGTRTEPNLELLAQLRPELILITPLLEDIRDKLERIAPVVSYDDFTQDQDNLLMQRENFLALAQRVGRTPQAHQQLAAMDDSIARMRERLIQHFGAQLPDTTVIRFASPTVVYINGPNSMPQHAMQLLGLQPAYDAPVSRWGNIQTSVTVLGNIDDGAVLYIEPFAQGERLFATQLWQAMPFVRSRRFAGMRSTWTHGGVFCVEYLAAAITDALLTLPPRH
ncbi:MAG TPA: iron-siderophore ABC transporter substrate-binding protein [Pseudomonas xinjiangensis]|uniref:Iron-siderophore ABC transporter substrate-binding protein n=2 Tax=root TaxID=1 RepID=A0A7V1BP35_9GAMM|nr:iron-siderophore ABC transporter substrate-binding protein [Halopseudomonas xinjiangensis]HEC46307.1 iron-siderophore ABC transporter substrate-binding protein [Halopseudomonas xinjiangensis]